MSGKANAVHRKDVLTGFIQFLCSSRQYEDQDENIVAGDLGIPDSDIILSRKRLPYLDSLCQAKANLSNSG